MLDFFVVITEGGLRLWSYHVSESKLTYLNEFISKVLIEGNKMEKRHVLEDLESKLKLGYVTAFVGRIQKEFCNTFKDQLEKDPGGCFDYMGQYGFKTRFESILKSSEETTAPNIVLSGSSPSLISQLEADDERPDSMSFDSKPSSSPPVKKAGKEKRSWGGRLSKEEAAKLDYAGASDSSRPTSLTLSHTGDEILDIGKRHSLTGSYADVGESDTSVDLALLDSDAAVKTKDGTILSFFKNVTGQKPLEEADTADVLKKMKEHLMTKNVAAHVADQICEAIGADLLGQKLGTFQSISQLVRSSAEQSIRRILTPSSAGGDLFQEMAEAKAIKKPYVASFIGVNGVGKSTTLSKVCFWSLKKDFKVLIAACDTFRSGAVEQLGSHVHALASLFGEDKIHLFQRGYGKDAAAIAQEAIQYASKNAFDVVLIDTAGRMQDNEPLMRALAKLVSINQPDKIIFVGEALVGNEALDQLVKFNRAIKDYGSDSSRARQIDGIILTKFDTIDDKVGAALTMASTSKASILFVGAGQTYADLFHMNVKDVIDTLLKP